MLISLDTLRADHLSAYGYHRQTSPHIDALAADGVRFSETIAASHWTAPSHATLLTGLHPDEHDVVTDSSRMSPEITTLAERLSDAGYATGAFTGSHLVTALLGMDQGFGVWQERPGPCATGFADAAAWMSAQTSPFFLFVHTYQTHAPYAPPAPYDTLFTPDGPLPDRAVTGQFRQPGAPPTPAELSALVGLYDGEIRAADACVGALIASLGERSDDTLVVLTSDHGEEFFEHGGFGHGRLLPETLAVPLILSHPLLRAEAAAVIDVPTGAVDVVPTVLDLLGVPVPDDLSGFSLVPAMTGTSRPRPVALSSSGVSGLHAALRDADGHYFQHPDAERLFVSTPLGLEDVLTDTPEAVLAGYREPLRAWLASLSPRAPAIPIEYTTEQVEALHALGYIDWGE